MFNIFNDFLNQSSKLITDIIVSISKIWISYCWENIKLTIRQSILWIYISITFRLYMCCLKPTNLNPELYINYKEKYNQKLWNGVI